MTDPPPGPGAADAVFRPVRAGNAFEETVERLLQAIKLGVVQEGERLPPERELSGRLGVSRMTLREVIDDLRKAGWVESRRGRLGGTFVRRRPVTVTRPPAELVRRARELGGAVPDVLALRGVLEAGAVELAASRELTGAERELLVRRLAECEGAAPAAYRVRDSRLHLALAELSGSASLAAAVADARARVNDLLDAIPLLARNIQHSDAQHAAIVAAVLAGEPEGARSAMREHTDGTAALLRGFLG
jgi:DNA-binding FadR family transcriptional regulator